jgi:hypothetical protein
MFNQAHREIERLMLRIETCSIFFQRSSLGSVDMADNLKYRQTLDLELFADLLSRDRLWTGLLSTQSFQTADP